MPKTQTLRFADEKKHSVRYDAAADLEPMLTSVYVRKGDLPKPFPTSIKVTIEEAK